MKTKIFIFALALITIFGFILRFRNLAAVPFPGQSQDEYSNTWVGLSLIELGMPVGMSGTYAQKSERIYANPDRIFQQTAGAEPMTIAYPWFDHPPLVGLVTGSFAYLRGARVFEDATAGVIRKPALLFSTATIFVTGLLGATIFGNPVGLLAALFYAVSPLLTVTGRMVQAENFLTPLGLLAIYFIYQFIRQRQKLFLYLAAGLLMAGVLAKLSALAFVLAAALLLFTHEKQRWPVWLVIFSGLAAVSWWVLFGLALSPSAFWSALTGNSSRVYGIGFQAVADLVTTTKVTGTKTLVDGWIIASFIALFGLLLTKAKNKEWLAIPALSYLALYLFFGSESYGWYRIPFYPFGIIALAYLTIEAIKSAEIPITFLLLVPAGVSLSKLASPTGNLLWWWRVLPVTGLAAAYLFRNKTLNRMMIFAVLIAAVLISLFYNLRIDTNFWYSAT